MKSSTIPLILFALIISSSNYLVQFPINDYLTWGAFVYPLCFLVTELCTLSFGATKTRRIIWIGFFEAILLNSLFLPNKQIILASSVAFLASQLLDIAIFSRLRNMSWYLAPLCSSFLATTLDTFLFFAIAFHGVSELNWIDLAIGDGFVKVFVDLGLLVPFRIAMRNGSLRTKMMTQAVVQSP